MFLNTKKANVLAGCLLAVGLLFLLLVWWLSRPEIRPYQPEPSQLAHADSSGFPVAETNSLGIVMRLIPPGTYTRGSPPEEKGRRLNERQQPLVIPHTFSIAATETTQEQFEQLMGYNPSSTIREGREDVPVDSITFEEALLFCNALSEREGLDSVYSRETGRWEAVHERDGYRLPLEAEWEYATRATTTNAFYTGPISPVWQGRRNIWRAAWYSGTARGRPRDVGQREANPWGVYDSLGNVWEWCWDWYAEYPLTQEVDLRGPDRSNQGRIIRGGCWYDDMERCRAATRRFHFPGEPLNVLGFRVARTVIPPESWVVTVPEQP